MSDIKRCAVAYSKAGFCVFKARAKYPLKNSKWADRKYLLPEEVEEEFSGWSGNLGIALTDRQLVIDIDPRNFNKDDRPDKRLFEKAGIDFREYAAVVKTGGTLPGFHIYFKLPKDHPKIKVGQKDYKGIDFKSIGGYVIGAGSTHPDTGNLYEPRKGSLSLSEIKEAPKSLLDLLNVKEERQVIDTGLTAGDMDVDPAIIDMYAGYLKNTDIAMEGDGGDALTYQVACTGRGYGLSMQKTYDCMLEHFNPRCEPSWTPEELSMKVENAYEYASGSVGDELAIHDFKPVVDPDSEEGTTRIRGWDYIGNTNALKATINNAGNFLQMEEYGMTGCLVYDEFARETRMVKRFPWMSEHRRISKYGIEWSDGDTIDMMMYFGRELKFDMKMTLADQAIEAVARSNVVHPVRDYLRALTWDGKPRLAKWLTKYCGAEDNEYISALSQLTLMQAVKRIYEPGCKVDDVLVLEGEQGVGKSTIIEILGGDFSAALHIDPGSKDTVDAMQGKWIIEMVELNSSFKKYDNDRLKGFISYSKDTVRLAYARRSITFNRQSIFIATINPDATGAYLIDSTGNRRYHPVTIKGVIKGCIDFDGLIAARDQLFAEAVDLYLRGEDTYIKDVAIKKLALEQQHLRKSEDSYAYNIGVWITKEKPYFITGARIWEECLGGTKTQMGNVHQRRIANVLKEMGYISDVRKKKGRSVRGYTNMDYRPVKADDRDLFA